MQTDPRLIEATQLIQDNKAEAARTLLRGILALEADNVEARYLYALVAEGRQEAEQALNRVLELDPLHYRAKAALNKLQRRSVEQLPESESSDFNLAFLLPILLVVLVVAVGAVVALFVLTQEDDEPPASDAPAAAQNQTQSGDSGGSSVIVQTRIATADGTYDLPATWTPAPTLTPPPTRTAAPTMTPVATRTTRPTLTPTQPQVALIEPSLLTFNRLLSEYYELTAPSAVTQEVERLSNIRDALFAIASSIQLYDYEAEDVDPEIRNYAGNFVILLERAWVYAEARENALTLEQNCLTNADEQTCDTDSDIIAARQAVLDTQAARVAQEELVQSALAMLTNSATATQAFEDAINGLRTPTITPIVVSP